jgi:hypothetical protein
VADQATPLAEVDQVLVEQSDERLQRILATELSDVTLPIERGKVMEFARAIGAIDAVFFEPAVAHERGLRDVPAPPTFSQVVSHWNGGDAADLPRALGLDLARVVHGTQSYSYGRPVTAGEVLTGVRCVSEAHVKESRGGGLMTFATVQTTFRDEAGLPVLRERMSIIERPANRKGASS